MAIGWVSALKLVPWGDVIQAAPHVLKAAKGLLNKSEAEPTPTSSAIGDAPADAATTAPAYNAGELALQHVAQLEARIQQLEQAQRDSALLLQQMAEQQSQIVQTVGLLRTGATRLAWACGVLGVALISVLVYVLRS